LVRPTVSIRVHLEQDLGASDLSGAGDTFGDEPFELTSLVGSEPDDVPLVHRIPLSLSGPIAARDSSANAVCNW
jgi:hypothetical protein